MSSFNEAVRWSRLSRFGSSNLARLTIITPFLGFLIFLNTGIEEYVSLGPSDISEGWVKYFSDRRIELLYLGLSLLGASTGLFSLLAPDTIKSSGQYSDYIQFKEDTKTRNAVEGSLEATLDACSTHNISVSNSFHDIPVTWSFPLNLKESIYRLTISVFEQSEELYVPKSAQEEVQDEDHFPLYYMFNGLPNIDPILECVVSRRRVDFGIWKGFYYAAEDSSIDVFRLEYLRKDYSAPILRCTVFGMFLLGSAVAIFPTLVSIWLVFKYSF